MAITNGNPIKITATTTAYNAGLPATITAKPLKVRKIEWFNPAATTDTFSIQENTSSNVLLEGKCEVANQSQMFDFSTKPLILPKSSDWKVTMTSGTIYIWHD